MNELKGWPLTLWWRESWWESRLRIKTPMIQDTQPKGDQQPSLQAIKTEIKKSFFESFLLLNTCIHKHDIIYFHN